MKFRDKIFKRLEDRGFYGEDIDIETCIFDYNIIIRESEENERFVYSFGFLESDFLFDWGYVSESDFDDSWIEKESVMEYIGYKGEWDALGFDAKLFSCFQYYGSESFLGGYWKKGYRNFLSRF